MIELKHWQMAMVLTLLGSLVMSGQTALFAQSAPPAQGGKIFINPPSTFRQPPTPPAPAGSPFSNPQGSFPQQGGFPQPLPGQIGTHNPTPQLGAVVIFKEGIAIGPLGPRQHIAGYIESVPKNSLGEKIGLLVGDELLLVNGNQVRSLDEYRFAADAGNGTLALTVRGRDGKTRNLSYKTPAPAQPAPPIIIPPQQVLDQGTIIFQGQQLGNWVLDTNGVVRYALIQPCTRTVLATIYDQNNMITHQSAWPTNQATGIWSIPNVGRINFGYIKVTAQ